MNFKFPIFFSLLVTLLLSSSSSIKPIINSDRHETLNMIYKNCSTSMSNYFPPQTFSSLFQELTSHSSNTKFYTTAAGDQNMAISGRFQCQNDLTAIACHNCVQKLSKISTSLCGQSIPARIHLSGCYSHFELDEPGPIEESMVLLSKLTLQHKSCGGDGDGDGSAVGAFKAARDEAFVAAQEGTATKGYYFERSREGMRVKAQCDGSLIGGCDCGECVSRAVEVAMDECGDSFSGEVYLDGCYFIYLYDNSGFSGEYSRKIFIFSRYIQID
ncbi:plasmodesmata-located protein 2-like [Impatiens glandulifera]|uniref:plasmodesmata-located protein 2-like n=1 Tax=Impatiens glandulifera TaxID=253017 RepID=UPI001FB08EEC|nr:plasmodesmata-located protein 2-like [Impatiens glandulifera]